jgi:hypothetical protein
MISGGSSQSIILCTAAVLLAWAGTAGALDPGPKCQAGKNKEAGKYADCRQKTEAKAIMTGVPADYKKCDEKFLQKWERLEEQAGPGVCPDGFADPNSLAIFITNHCDAVAQALAGGSLPTRLLETGQTECDQGDQTLGACPGTPAGQDGEQQPGVERTGTLVDNGNGTVTDTLTGLTWEKLSDDDSIHDWDDTYTWLAAFATKIALLNSADFGGYSDWRVPTVTELQSIVNYGAAWPAAYAEFNTSCTPGCAVTICSCTRSYYYWSSTTYQDSPAAAWIVNPNAGGVMAVAKSTGNVYVRAVRGGL